MGMDLLAQMLEGGQRCQQYEDFTREGGPGRGRRHGSPPHDEQPMSAKVKGGER